MVQIIDNYAELQRAEMHYLIGQYPTASEHLKSLLERQNDQMVLVQRLANLGEIIYANRGEATDAGKMLCAQIAYINAVTAGGSFGYGADGRGLKMKAAMERELGESEGPDPAGDPDPKPEYCVPPPLDDLPD
jgi:hypothetical protein